MDQGEVGELGAVAGDPGLRGGPRKLAGPLHLGASGSKFARARAGRWVG